MAQAKHGPGPWRKQSGTTYISVIDANEHPILLNASPEVGAPREEHEANADLITAGPDLLAALEAMLQEAEAAGMHETGEPWATYMSMSRAAIIKAKGEK